MYGESIPGSYYKVDKMPEKYMRVNEKDIYLKLNRNILKAVFFSGQLQIASMS